MEKQVYSLENKVQWSVFEKNDPVRWLRPAWAILWTLSQRKKSQLYFPLWTEKRGGGTENNPTLKLKVAAMFDSESRDQWILVRLLGQVCLFLILVKFPTNHSKMYLWGVGRGGQLSLSTLFEAKSFWLFLPCCLLQASYPQTSHRFSRLVTGRQIYTATSSLSCGSWRLNSRCQA